MTGTSQIEIYEAEDGKTRIEIRLEKDTLWLSQAQMAELFGKDVRTINEHLQTIYKEGELEKAATIRKFRIVRNEGARQVKREIEHYNLDAAISVGYRVNSRKGTTEYQGTPVPTVGVFLLFGNNRLAHFPEARIQAGRFAG